jgi:hypothetical protein
VDELDRGKNRHADDAAVGMAGTPWLKIRGRRLCGGSGTLIGRREGHRQPVAADWSAGAQPNFVAVMPLVDCVCIEARVIRD